VIATKPKMILKMPTQRSLGRAFSLSKSDERG